MNVLTNSTLRSVGDRFWSKVEKHDADCECCNGCWHWRGGADAKGYGRFWVYGRLFLTHRVAYALTRGEPGDLFVCHRCDNPPCVNPDHLFLGTHSDNMRDCAAKGRFVSPNRWAVRGERLCSVDGCGCKHWAKGLCRPHYQRLRRVRVAA